MPTEYFAAFYEHYNFLSTLQTLIKQNSKNRF